MRLNYHIYIVLLFITCLTACSKVEYTKIDSPAYLRVFNNLNYTVGLENKDEERPFLTMLIDPVLDADSMPVSALIKGDFLDKRDPYAPPYPSHIGSSTSVNNPEYPGKENVLVGPVLNGFDLSSWAQVPSGKHRIMFFYRPFNEVPFFDLEPSLKKKVLIDTSIDLTAREVYTLHVLQEDFNTKENGILLRQEDFQKQPLSDSLVYVNFYNLSAKGFWEADNSLKKQQFKSGLLQYGIRDEMNIWLSLYAADNQNTPLPGHLFNYLTTIERNTTSGKVAPYMSFPLFADGASNGINTALWEQVTLLAPGMNPYNIPYINAEDTYCTYGVITCYKNGNVSTPFDAGLLLPNMVVNIHSGVNNPQSFSTVNTIEIVNGNAYLTTVQRKYPPPVY